MKRFICAAAVSFCAAAAFGQVSYTGGAYTQDFDTLPTTGTANAWTNNSTLPGWYAMNSRTGGTLKSGRDEGSWVVTPSIRAGDGSSNAGGVYSFGTVGSSDRALGSVGSTNAIVGDSVYALVLQNNTGITMTSFSLTYNGEQWRDGGNADSRRSMLDFDYGTFAAAPGNADLQGGNLTGYTGADPTVWTNDSSRSLDQVFGNILAGTSANATPGTLDFAGPVGTTVAAAVNGNGAGLVSGINGVISINWLPGEYLVLRWWDNDSVGFDHGLAIDDVNFEATPEPTSLALLALGGLALLRRR